MMGDERGEKWDIIEPGQKELGRNCRRAADFVTRALSSMFMSSKHHLGFPPGVAVAVLLAALPAASVRAQRPDTLERNYGRVEADIRSDYSHIKLRKLGRVCTLFFVRDNGDEVVETMVNLDHPQDLLIDYTQYMFLSYAHRPEQKKVLVVGLGGGSMVHFLKISDPALKIDVVEIDPQIVDLANKYFQIRSEGNVKIICQDAFKYLAETTEKYDVIYMDAFLKPSQGTDPNGVPLALKTTQFY